MVKQVVGACSVVLALTVAASAQTRAGGEFRINTYTTGYQAFGRAAMEPDGDFVVVWTSYAQDGSDYGAFGQRFAAAGARRGMRRLSKPSKRPLRLMHFFSTRSLLPFARRISNLISTHAII